LNWQERFKEEQKSILTRKNVVSSDWIMKTKRGESEERRVSDLEFIIDYT